MIEIKLDISGALNALQDFEDLLSSQISMALEKTAKKVASEARKLVRRNSTDRGILARSGRVEKVSDYIFQVVFDAPHAAFIEFGTQPHRPPFEPLFEWVLRNIRAKSVHGGYKEKVLFEVKVKDKKGWSKIGGYQSKKGVYVAKEKYDKEARSITWRIIRKIEKEGTEPKPFIRPPLDMAQIWFREFLKRGSTKKVKGIEIKMVSDKSSADKKN